MKNKRATFVGFLIISLLIQPALALAQTDNFDYEYIISDNDLTTYQTMTAQDILEGRLNVEIGMAAVRPAEFIILKFSHKMQEA